MKKLKLNLVNLQSAQVLSREQLKKVMGGDDGSGGDGGIDTPCKNKCELGTECYYMMYNKTIKGKCGFTSCPTSKYSYLTCS